MFLYVSYVSWLVRWFGRTLNAIYFAECFHRYYGTHYSTDDSAVHLTAVEKGT